MLIMIVLGMWACQWRELQPISFGFGGNPPARSGEPADANANNGGTYELLSRAENG